MLVTEPIVSAQAKQIIGQNLFVLLIQSSIYKVNSDYIIIESRELNMK